MIIDCRSRDRIFPGLCTRKDDLHFPVLIACFCGDRDCGRDLFPAEFAGSLVNDMDRVCSASAQIDCNVPVCCIYECDINHRLPHGIQDFVRFVSRDPDDRVAGVSRNKFFPGCRVVRIRILIKPEQQVFISVIKKLRTCHTIVCFRGCVLVQVQRNIGLEITEQDLRRMVFCIQVICIIDCRNTRVVQ